MSDLLRGVVKWFNDAKGFGFIEHETGRDVFVHYSVIEQDGFKTLKDGEAVEYELKEGEKGLHAARVARVDTSTSSSISETDGSEAAIAAVAAASDAIAPNLESGSINTLVKTTREMIEVERTPANPTEEPDLPLSHSVLADEDSESLER